MTPALIATLITLGISVVGGAISGTAAVIDKKNNDVAQQKQLEDQLAYMDAQYEAEKAKAEKSADDLDRQVSNAEATAGLDLNQAVQNLGQTQANNTLSYTNAHESIDSTTGQALSSAASSGTKGSSVIQAAAMTKEGANNELKAQKETDELSAALQLSSVSGQAAANLASFQYSRDQAQYQRDYYRKPEDQSLLSLAQTGLKNFVNGNSPTEGIDKGGTGYQLYQQYRKNYTTANSPDTSWQSYVSTFFTGTSAGAQAGYQLGNTAYKLGLYDQTISLSI